MQAWNETFSVWGFWVILVFTLHMSAATFLFNFINSENDQNLPH